MISTKGAPNPEAFLANRDIHEGRSESGGFFGPKASCTVGAPNPKAFLVNCDIHKGRSESGGFLAQRRHMPMGLRIRRLFGQS
ncbi:hypothetical protein ACSBR1_005111 [Camellia fascicularis]